jgi:hypothetical protein
VAFCRVLSADVVAQFGRDLNTAVDQAQRFIVHREHALLPQPTVLQAKILALLRAISPLYKFICHFKGSVYAL